MKKELIIYFSGFNTDPHNIPMKYTIFKDKMEMKSDSLTIEVKLYKQYPLKKDFDQNAEDKYLSELIKSYDKVSFVASSMGTIPALYHYFKNAVKVNTLSLINPSFYIEESVVSLYVEQWEADIVRAQQQAVLKHVDSNEAEKFVYLFLNEDDEVISKQHNEMFLEKFIDYFAHIHYSPKGGHNFTNIDEVMPQFESIFKQ